MYNLIYLNSQALCWDDHPTAPNHLNVGCGNQLFPTHINIDNRHPDTPSGRGMFLLGDITHLFNVVGRGPTGVGFESIYASYVFEHLPSDRHYGFLYHCNRVLQTKGTLEIVVPDFDSLVKHYLLDPSLATHRLLQNELMGQYDPLVPHTSVWTKNWLEHYLNAEGFKIESCQFGSPESQWALQIKAVKIHEKYLCHNE